MNAVAKYCNVFTGSGIEAAAVSARSRKFSTRLLLGPKMSSNSDRTLKRHCGWEDKYTTVKGNENHERKSKYITC